MCEANAYMLENNEEVLVMEAVDKVEPIDDDNYRIISIFGEQKNVKGRVLRMNLLDHKIVFAA